MQEDQKNRDELEKEIELLKKRVVELEAAGEKFISYAAHKIRTPLAIIKEGVSLLLDRVPGEINEQQTKILTAAKNNVDRMAQVINELLQYKGGKDGRE